MADTKISALTAASAVASTNEFAINEAGTSKKVTAAQIKTFTVNTPTASNAQQVITAATVTYLTGSGILIPPSGLVAGQNYTWYIYVSKTAAGTATPIWTFRIGSAKTTSDATVLTITGTAQVATASGTLIIVTASVRSVSATGVVVGAINTGAASFGIGGMAASSAFDNTGKAGQFFGLAVNTGTSAAWTVEAVFGKVEG
jgi:hypothetical protein